MSACAQLCRLLLYVSQNVLNTYDKVKFSNLSELKSRTVDTFERGQSDIFVVGAVDVGTIKKIRIEQDGRGRGADWFLERVVVTNQVRAEIVLGTYSTNEI